MNHALIRPDLVPFPPSWVQQTPGGISVSAPSPRDATFPACQRTDCPSCPRCGPGGVCAGPRRLGGLFQGAGDALGRLSPSTDRRTRKVIECPEETPAVPIRVLLAASYHGAALEASMAMPKVSEVGLEAAVAATLNFARGLRARMEAGIVRGV